MRGKDVHAALEGVDLRITPAYAGKSGRFVNILPDPQGSPPRMRGKDQELVKVIMLIGITPAYAGKSRPGLELFLRLKDHPRVCGEKATSLAYVPPS